MKNNKGITLLELVIAVAIVAILSSIAWPNYQNYVTNARRTAAASCLMEMGQYMERFYTINMSYESTSDGQSVSIPSFECQSSLEGFYSFALDDVSPTFYELSASPQGVQESRDQACGALYYESNGLKRVSGSSPSSSCW